MQNIKNKVSPIINEQTYTFNDKGRLVNTKNNDGFVYTTQTDYETLGAYVTEQVYNLLCFPPYSLQCILLSGKNAPNEPATSLPKNESFIFVSKNFEVTDKLVVIIHGTGTVRAGQWSQRLIINESLEVGSQLPYIKYCIDNGWGILVTNTNDNYYLDNNNIKKRSFFLNFIYFVLIVIYSKIK